jgi:hypothetical protein
MWEVQYIKHNMQGNDTNMIVMTDKAKAFVWKVGLWVIKIEGESLDKFSRLKNFVEENSVEANDTGNDQCIKDLNLEPRISKYFPEAVSDKFITCTLLQV